MRPELVPANTQIEVGDLRAGRRTVTPELARSLLELNTANRPVSRREVERLKAIIASGQWLYNGESIKISQSGRLLDGQHRLLAIAEGGVSAELRIETGLADNVFTTLDQGRKRTGGDVLAVRGVLRYNATATAAATLYRMLRNRPIYGPAGSIPAYGIDIVVDRHPGLVDSVSYCAPLIRQGDGAVVSLGQLAALHYVLDSVMGLEAEAQLLAEGLAVGTGLEVGSPVLQFRNKVFAARASKHIAHAQAKLSMLAKVAGLHIAHDTVKHLHGPATGAASYWALIPGLKDVVEHLGDEQALRDLPY